MLTMGLRDSGGGLLASATQKQMGRSSDAAARIHYKPEHFEHLEAEGQRLLPERSKTVSPFHEHLGGTAGLNPSRFSNRSWRVKN
jgi:hypothetical protein